MSAMAEATRLTRQGRVLEATALIQQTLTSLTVTRPAPDAPGPEDSGWIPRRRTLPRRPASSLRRPHRPASPAVKRTAGQFSAFSYSNAAGSRTYRLYVPSGGSASGGSASGGPGGPLPLVVMLHGGTQDAATFDAATGMNDLAEREKFLVA